MKKKQIKYTITLMSIALVALMVVQFTWIKNAIELENEKFDRNVHEALLGTVNRIEKNETKNLALKKVFDIDEEDNPVVVTDSLISDTLKTSGSSSFVWNYSVDDNTELRVASSDADSGSVIFISVESDDDEDSESIEKQYVFEKRVDSLYKKTSSVVNEVVNELINLSEKKSLAERLNHEKIKLYLTDELIQRGISTDFSFAVKSEKPDTLFFLKNRSNREYFIRSKYKAKLFPGEFFNNKAYLILNFPSRTSYVINSILIKLLLSVFLIIAIVFLYYKTVKILLKQKRISDIKNDLINNITHEFKTPISTIALACEALNEPKLLDDFSSVEKYTGMISEENQRLKKMVEELLNTAVFENGKIKIEKKKINVHRLIEKIYNNYKLKVEKQNGMFGLDLKADQPELQLDQLHFTNVLNNLVDNAIKYSTGNPRIKITTKNKNNIFYLFVIDEGKGIDKQHQKKIFDSFYRVPSGDVHDVKGYGLGLSYVKKIVEAHNGKIYVKSKHGKGTVFTIELNYD